MASSKRRNKDRAAERRGRMAGLPPVPPKDGDRRRRTIVDLVREALQRKQAVRDWTIDDLPRPDAPEGP